MHFVLPFCYGKHGDVVIQISKHNWQEEMSKLLDFSWYLPLIVGKSSLIKTKFLSVKFTLRNLLKHSNPHTFLLQRGILKFLFPNTIFIKTTKGRTSECQRFRQEKSLHGDSVEVLEPITKGDVSHQYPRVDLNSSDTYLPLQFCWDD